MIPQKPYRPWQVDEKEFPTGGALEHKLKFLISYAILAPNSHNTQPWLFRVSRNQIEIMPNFKRSLDYSDRTYRELYISLGCALGNILVAAEYFGFSYNVDYLPEDRMEEVAVLVVFSESRKMKSELSVLFPFIPKRVTNRAQYKTEKIKNEILNEAQNLVDESEINIHFFTKKTDMARAGQLIYEAHMFAYGDKYFKEELSKWVRPVYTSKTDGMPLFGLGVPRPLTILARNLIKGVPAKLQSTKDKKLVASSPGVLVATSNDDTKENWLRAGKILEYILLSFTKNGIVVAPMAGVVEHEPSREKLKKLLKSKEHPLFFARFGYSEIKVHPSPRISASDLVVS
jgi:nitroreductase